MFQNSWAEICDPPQCVVLQKQRVQVVHSVPVGVRNVEGKDAATLAGKGLQRRSVLEDPAFESAQPVST